MDFDKTSKLGNGVDAQIGDCLLVNAARKPQPLDQMSLRVSVTHEFQTFMIERSPPLVVKPDPMKALGLRVVEPSVLPEGTPLWLVR